MARRAEMKGKILAKHINTGMVWRFAVHVTEGKDTVRVVMVEADYKGYETLAKMEEAVIEKACFPRFGNGTKLLFSVYDSGTVTGATEPVV